MVVKFYKKLGESSFGAIQRFREENPEYKDEKIAFAGRLDPMAEGEMIFLVGEDVKNKEDYIGLDKIYETEIILGIQTDTFDLMGLIKNINNVSISDSVLEKTILSKVGKQMQKFPPFSKRHVKGKALFVWASEGKLDEIEIPEHEVEIYEIEILNKGTRTFSEIKENAISRINDVVGDFRQEKIIKRWEEENNNLDQEFQTITLKITCGTGTYIRQFAEDLGEELGCGAMVFSIKRTEIFDKK